MYLSIKTLIKNAFLWCIIRQTVLSAHKLTHKESFGNWIREQCNAFQFSNTWTLFFSLVFCFSFSYVFVCCFCAAVCTLPLCQLPQTQFSHTNTQSRLSRARSTHFCLTVAFCLRLNALRVSMCDCWALRDAVLRVMYVCGDFVCLAAVCCL